MDLWYGVVRSLLLFHGNSSTYLHSWGAKGPWKGLTQESLPSILGKCKLLMKFTFDPIIDLLVVRWCLTCLQNPANLVSPPRSLTPSSDQIQTQYSQFEQLAACHTSLHHVGGLLCQNHDVFILSVILLCLCDKCRLCWRWDFFLSNLWT